MIVVNNDRKRQLEFTGIRDEDLKLLASHRELFAAITDEVVDRLYDRMLSQPELVRIINAHSDVEALKKTQRWYFQSMTDGTIDEAFIERRLKIGSVHSRIGLTTDWYLGAYMLYLDIATHIIQQALPDGWHPVIFSLSKMFNLDSQLVLEAYEQDEKAQLEQLAASRTFILTKVQQAVQELAGMIVKLGGSSQVAAANAETTSSLQDNALTKLGRLTESISEIHSIGHVMSNIADQTHLIGLNASIEAARAGEHGLGFGVVANEIRKLAVHSRDSLAMIQDRLEQIEKVLGEVKKTAEETSRHAKQQASGSQELADFVHMIGEVTEGLKQIRVD